MKHARTMTCLLVAAACGVSAVGLAACQDTSGGTPATGGAGGGTSATGGAGGAGGGQNAGPFQPQGCDFQVAPRPEYTKWSAGTTEVGATPNIRRVRLGLGGNVKGGAKGKADPATTAGFAWQTDDGTLASEVTWGDSPDPTSWPAANRATGVTWLTPPGLLNDNGEQRMHEVHVCGLAPETTHYYRVGGGPAGQEVWSEVYSFTTTPSDPATPVKILVAGDSRGQNNDAWRVLQKKALLLGPTLQMFSGDMINLAPDQAEWEKWLDSAWKDSDGKLLTLGQILTLSAHGNHDNHTTLFYGNLVLPQDVQTYPQYAELFFSVDVGPVHIIVIDDGFIAFPNSDTSYKDVMGAWLTADLVAANENRDKVPWIVAMHHHPELSSSLHGKDADVRRVRDFLVPIWDQYHVNLAIAGHDHNYERFEAGHRPGRDTHHRRLPGRHRVPRLRGGGRRALFVEH